MEKLTKNRAQLLRVFFTNPERSFYMQELGRIIGKKPGVFQRTLCNLEKEGILTSEYKANARYFKVNTEYPLFKEFKSIIFKTVGVSGSIKEAIGTVSGVKAAFIYGSFANNQEHPASDIDLLIVGRHSAIALQRQLSRLQKELGREINTVNMDEAEFNRRKKNKDPFISGLFKKKYIQLK